jgi:hypothetical protein
MSKKTKSIPVNHFGVEPIYIEKISFKDFPVLAILDKAERHVWVIH